MKSLPTLLCFLFLSHLSMAQGLICPFVITTDSVLISNLKYQIETIEPGQSSGPLSPAPMVGLCIDAAALPPVSAGGTYRIYPEKDDDDRNGVTTFDIVITSRHILNLYPLDFYQQLAADVDGNLVIDVNDLGLSMDLILYLTTDLPVPSWQFVDAAVVPTSLADLKKNYIEFDAANPPATVSFYGIKSGDVNSTSHPLQGSPKAADRNSEELVFQVADRMVQAGETVSVDFLAKDFDKVRGYQFTLNFAAEALEFQEQQDVDLPDDYFTSLWNFDVAEEGKIPSLWLAGGETGQVEDGAVLFNITFLALQDGQLSDLLSAGDEITANVAYKNETNDRFTIVLDFSQTTSIQNTANASFQLFQNQPNPLVQSTTIPFHLEKATAVQLVISDALGRIIKTIQTQGVAGEQAINLDRSDFGAAGLYHYTLITEDGQSSQALLVK